MILWPETHLPLPKDTLAVQDDPRLMRQEMEVGTRQRNRFSDVIERVNVTWEFNHVQWTYFKTFVAVTLFNGAEEFSMTLPTVDRLQRVTVKMVGGQYSERYFVGGIDVSAQIEIIKPPVLDEVIFYLMSISDGVADGVQTYDDDFIAMDDKLFTSINSIPTI